MQIAKFTYVSTGGEDWTFSAVEFQPFNLLVGDSATGKTRLLNTLFNIGRFVASDEYKSGHWIFELMHDSVRYEWELATDGQDEEDPRIVKEVLTKYEEGEPRSLIRRSRDSFFFDNSRLPRLQPRVSALSLLREENEIRPIYNGFSTIQRRRFFDTDLADISKLEPPPRDLMKRDRNITMEDIYYKAQVNLNARLYLLARHFPTEFANLRDAFRDAFPFVSEAEVRDITDIAPHLTFPVEIPVFCIREQGSDQWLPVVELSSGMQKILLILTDLYIMPSGAIYIIDEYENSLGVSAINFFPEFILNLEKQVQVFVTSHHPYLINNVPPDNWYLFNRTGRKITIRYGKELLDRLGKSRQQAFIKLINDPVYRHAIE